MSEPVRPSGLRRLVAAFGVAAELSQWLTDGRQPKLEDAALNVAGGLTGVLLAHLLCLALAFSRRRRVGKHG